MHEIGGSCHMSVDRYCLDLLSSFSIHPFILYYLEEFYLLFLVL